MRIVFKIAMRIVIYRKYIPGIDITDTPVATLGGSIEVVERVNNDKIYS